MPRLCTCNVIWHRSSKIGNLGLVSRAANVDDATSEKLRCGLHAAVVAVRLDEKLDASCCRISGARALCPTSCRKYYQS